MSKGIVAVDCDLTIARSDEAWWKWLCKVTGNTPMLQYLPLEDQTKLDYDLRTYFLSDLEKEDRDGYDFWRSTTVYDYVEPAVGSITALKELKEAGYEIIIVSATKGNHTKSKWQFLQRHFPFVDGFMATKEKRYARCDWFIDDRNDVLNRLGDNVGKIRIATPYTQSEELNSECHRLETWGEIKNLILQGGVQVIENQKAIVKLEVKDD